MLKLWNTDALKDFELDDYSDLLLPLSAAQLDYFLEGGQAVNAWAESFLASNPKLSAFEPFTSKDCDIWVADKTLKQLPKILTKGKLHKATDPADVQVGIFTTRHNPPMELDLLGGVFGIHIDDLPKVQKRVMNLNDVHVMDPLYLFKAKCHNLVHLPQGGRQDLKHVQMLREIVPSFFSYLLAQGKAGAVKERPIIQNLKLFRRFKRDPAVAKALQIVDGTIDDMIPVEELKTSGLPKVERFAQSEWGSRGKASSGDTGNNSPSLLD